MEVIRIDKLNVNGGSIEIRATLDDFEGEEFYNVEVDGVEWFTTESKMHCIVLYEMMKDHITEYMHYEKIK